MVCAVLSGATGLRGWIYIDGNNSGQQGLITAPSRQILITMAEPPASAVLAVDEVILGAMAANSGVVPLFSGDCRKAFGVALGDADYAAVLTRLQAYARALAPNNLNLTVCNSWSWGYIGIFLSEYYLRTVMDGTPYTSVLHGINQYALALAKGQFGLQNNRAVKAEYFTRMTAAGCAGREYVSIPAKGLLYPALRAGLKQQDSPPA